MTASSTSENKKNKVMKRSLSLPKSIQMVVPEAGSEESSRDSFLQSSTPGKRRYMRRGSRCPTMLRAAASLPEDPTKSGPEFVYSKPPRPNTNVNCSFESSSSLSNMRYPNTQVTSSKATVDLVKEALYLSSNFHDLDIDTTN